MDTNVNQDYLLAKLKRDVNELRNENQRLKEKEDNNRRMGDELGELRRTYKNLLQQVDSDRTYYKQ